MPSSHHYRSTASVSSLSLSSMSSSSSFCSSSSSGASGFDSQHTALTSLSRMNNRPQQQRRARATSTAATTSWYGRPPRNRGPPSPLESTASITSLSSPSPTATSGQHGRGRKGGHQAPVIEYDDRNVHTHKHSQSQYSTATAPPCYDDTLSPSSPPIPSDPLTFSQFFPSRALLSISHSPSADGNHHLSVETQTSSGPLTLFHLRMHNLRAREFSLRRYARDSGREVCKSTRRQRKPFHHDELKGKGKRGSFGEGKMARKIGGMLGKKKVDRSTEDLGTTPVTGRPAVLHQRPSYMSPDQSQSAQKPGQLRRVDSGYSSGSSGSPSPTLQAAMLEARMGCMRDPGLEHLEEEPEDDFDDSKTSQRLEMMDDAGFEDEEDDEEIATKYQEAYLPKDTMKLEFSNYTHLDLRRKGTVATAKKYDFEYWGVKYAWKRVVVPHRRASTTPSTRPRAPVARRHSMYTAQAMSGTKSRLSARIELHLYSNERTHPIAVISPKSLSVGQEVLESELGSWVPPSTLQILSDDALVTANAADVCDIIVATGLFALTDDCIRRHWHESSTDSARFPRIPSGMGMNLPGKWPRMTMAMFRSKRSNVDGSQHIRPMENIAVH